MDLKTLKNKGKLILKKREKLTEDVVNRYTDEEAQLQLNLLEDAFSKYNEAYDLKIVEANDEEMDKLIEDLETVSDYYVKAKGKLTGRLHERTAATSVSEKSENSNNTLRLPPINIPTFEGDFDDWYPFKDQFISIIHSNTSIDNTRKMYYLKSSLKGAAAQIIESMATIGDNYLEAWTLLLSRYDNERLIVQSHVQQLLTQTVHQTETAVGLKSLLDSTNKHLRALSVLQQPVDKWDAIIIGIVATRLPTEVRRCWEIESASYPEIPTWTKLKRFIENRLQALNMLQYKPSTVSNVINAGKTKQFVRTTAHLATDSKTINQCSICTQNHIIYKCNTFMKSKPSERLNLAKKAKICFNCLRTTHGANQCTNEKTCKNCGLKYHTLLHLDIKKVNTPEGENTTSEQEKEHGFQSTTSHLGAAYPTTSQNIILSTVLVHVSGKNGRTVLCRALLDSGSQSHFVTSSFITELGINRTKTRVIVNGISSAETTVTEMAECTVTSRLNHKQYQITGLVTPSITVKLPVNKLDTSNWHHLQGIQLADPTFHLPGKIDMLIGAEFFYDILQDSKHVGPKGTPILQNSRFGWIVVGCSNNIIKDDLAHITTNVITCCATYQQLEKQIENFWNIEEVPRVTIMSKEDQISEDHFIKTFKRNENGRYVVRLPFKETPHSMNSSYDIAVRRLAQVERSLIRNPSVYNQYREFMIDYLRQNHMEPVQPTEDSPVIFLPHHHVSRPSSVTTKLRVVFDGSALIYNGKSLNDMLHRGPKLQRDIVRIMTRFRMHRYVYTADIRQMFRQINIHSDDQCYQGIVWRNHPSEPIEQFKLKTVTYGLITSPYHALRTLAQLAVDEQVNYPEGSTMLKNDFYVDEIMSGCNDINDAKAQIQQLIDLLHQGGFDLRKWASNTPTLLENIPAEHQTLQISMPEQNSVSVLGVSWNTTRDTFSFKVKPLPSLKRITKRELLSEIARTYDPCGWLAPLIIVVKILMQQLWQTGTEWNDPVPNQLLEHWIAHRTSYNHLQHFEIPRHVGNIIDCQQGCFLHGFSDSSERAYAAAIYIVSNNTGHLLVSKTRVAPLKRITIPRLELCGATLLAQLMHSLMESLQLKIDTITMWTDSTVTLQWIQSDANKWTTFP
ncbi:uncharacterized protein LOC126551649 [Aphis gossypii]|uniref:uncharacterized protein LOC126551646 n=1 Tax=Aphis gossypii TaxID=80765 RepID=UPI0021591864|nr:uncharacterized protein LOC126551646 [Aphis gossypii]XP_050061523.1 uncharacterized protein LOC126551649 [Aphis gossypii]